MSRLDGRVAIVTGAAQGIGAALAKGLAAEGARVAIADILDAGDAVAVIEAAGGEALGIKTDVSDPASVGAMVSETVARFGKIDILVNNAAMFASVSPKPFTAISVDEWDKMMAVNVRGPFLCCQAVAPEMRKRQYGRIINISSGTVFKGAPMLLHYVSSKGAVLAMTRSLSRELGDDNIGVNSIAPGFTESEGILANEDFSAPMKQMQVAQRAFKRPQTPEDLVGTCVFLASADSDFITGQTILVDGGALTH
ncbi:MAG: SDR family NAD(P)-dependent oxidoreductase [Sphingomonadales bacterium]